jgi:hypothetical protein
MRSSPRSPAQLYALIIGVVLVAAGIAGFFWEASFATGVSAGVEQDFLLDVLAVNGWHNLFHVLSGILALAVAGGYASARLFALGFGALYALLALLGFVATENDALLGLIAINTEDNILHIVIAVAGIAAGLLSPADRPAEAATASSSSG